MKEEEFINNDILNAIIKNDIDKVKTLLKLNKSFHFNQNLYYACEHNLSDIVNLLLKQNKLNQQNINMALNIAADNGSFESFRNILTYNKKYTNLNLSNVNKALQVAIRNEYINIIELILNDKQINPTAYDNSAIRVAVDINNEKIIKILWNNKYIKNSLKNDNKYLYDKLYKLEFEKKMKRF